MSITACELLDKQSKLSIGAVNIIFWIKGASAERSTRASRSSWVGEIKKPPDRTETFFVEALGESLNVLFGHPKSHFIYQSVKRKVGEAMQVAGVQHLEPFIRPVHLWFFPQVMRGKSGHILKQFDAGNFGATNKIIEDWLVKLGKIRNDTPDCVFGCHAIAPRVAEDGFPGIWVVVREAREAAPLGYQESMDLIEPPAF